MLSVTEITINPQTDKARVSLFADTKADVVLADAKELVGRDLEMGSSVLTAAGEIAFLKSDGTFSWV